MKKIFCLILAIVMALSTSSLCFAFDTSDFSESDLEMRNMHLEHYDREKWESGQCDDFVDNSVIVALISKISKDLTTVDNDFFDIEGITEIKSLNGFYPVDRREEGKFRLSVVITLDTHDKTRVLDVIDLLMNDERVCYAEPNGIISIPDTMETIIDMSGLGVETEDKIYESLETREPFKTHNRRFKKGSSKLTCIQTYGKNGFVFEVENSFSIDDCYEDMRFGPAYYTQTDATEFGYYNVSDKIVYSLAEAYEGGMLTSNDVLDLSRNVGMIVRCGDINNDKIIDVLDVTSMRGGIVGKNLIDKNRADINADGNFDVIDVVMARDIVINNK